MFENLRGMWETQSRGRKAGLVLALAAIVLLAGLGVSWLARDSYQVLFTDLDPQDGNAIISELDKMKVPYRIAGNGGTVLVDKDQVYKTRLQVMGKELGLRGGVGFEIFNNAELGVTEFAQKVNYQRALQGELSRTIMGFEEVKGARVHLVLPENGLFRKNAARPKASISLTMRDGGRLRPEQVTGIQRLVAASVPEIEPAAVTVLDQQGVALTPASVSDPEGESGSARLEVKKQTETYFLRKVAEVLDRTFGPGQALVSVDVLLNQDHARVSREDVIPALRKDGEPIGVVTRKRTQSQGLQLTADLGLRRRAEQGLPASEPLTRGNASASDEVEYQIGRKVEQVVSTPGSIKRISVGIIVPSSVDRGQIERLTRVVSMAVGLSAERGDAIAIYPLDQVGPRMSLAGPDGLRPLKREPAVLPSAPGPEAPDTAAGRQMPPRVADLVVWAVGAALLLVLLLAALLRRRGGPARKDEIGREEMLAQIRAMVAGERGAPSGGGGRS